MLLGAEPLCRRSRIRLRQLFRTFLFGGSAMIRTLVTLAAGIGVGAVGMTATQHEAQHKGAKVTTLAARDIVEKLDGKEAKVTMPTPAGTAHPRRADAPGSAGTHRAGSGGWTRACLHPRTGGQRPPRSSPPLGTAAHAETRKRGGPACADTGARVPTGSGSAA